MPKYKGKDVKVGDVIEVSTNARVAAIKNGFISATPAASPATLTVELDAEPKAPVIAPTPTPAPVTTTATTVAPK